MKKVLICEEHPIIRYAFSQIILTADEPFILNEVQTAEELLGMLNKDYVEITWDVLILGLYLSKGNDFEIIKKIKQDYPQIKIITFNIDFNEDVALRAIKAGASGYLTAEGQPEELLQAISIVMSGELHVCPRLLKVLAFDNLNDSNNPQHSVLSDREYQVLVLIASGKTAKQIADELLVSVKTISTYRGRLLEKMNMNTNAELTYYAIHNKLV